MCGRFERSSSLEVLSAEFNVGHTPPALDPGYNIAPGRDILILNDTGARQFLKSRWGFVPSWVRDSPAGARIINARSETVAAKPMFRDAFRKHRCLIIADGFYEWQKIQKKKVPVYIHLKSGKPFGLAGLYSQGLSETGKKFYTCTIITTDANDLLAPVHDRMPVIIPKDQEDAWLNPGLNDEKRLLAMLRPYPSENMEFYEVSGRLNSPRYNSPDTVKPLERKDSSELP
ncbi:MAG: hypothetical protein C0402_07550 [Thermodesulfovibrio sp.]|nr:hypothetical protein [Thermodesulfovibrio sp.]